MSSRVRTAACVIIIGNEILSGRTRDVNLQFLGDALNDIGIRVTEARVIADDEDTIISTVNECRGVFDYVFTTGGIGPTHDDITSACIAKAFGVRLIRNDQALALLDEHYRGSDYELNDARLKMADIPDGAALIANPISNAPGFQMENVFVLAGVPMIMKAMFDSLKDRLSGGASVLSLGISSFVSEGDMAAGLTAIQNNNQDAEIGCYPFVRHGRVGVSIVIRSINSATIEASGDEVRCLIKSIGGEIFEHEEKP